MYADIVETNIDDLFRDVVWKMNYSVKEGSELDKLITNLIYAYADAKDSGNTDGWADKLLLGNYNILADYYNTVGYLSLRAIVEDSVNTLVDRIGEDAYEARYAYHPGIYAKDM